MVHLVTRGDPELPEKTDVKVEDVRKIYTQFAVTVYDSLVAATASTSISTFTGLCDKLWPRFVWPAVSGEVVESGKASNKSKQTWDFARLLIRNRHLFQQNAEDLLIERLERREGAWTFEQLQKAAAAQPTSNNPSTSTAKTTSTAATTKPHQPLLKPFTTILLISSYLASLTPQKTDIILFSRLSTAKIRKRTPKKFTPKKQKSHSQTPTRSSNRVAADGLPTKSPSQQSSGMKAILGKTSAPKPFTLERVISILRAVHPDGFTGRGVADRVYREMGELVRMKLVERVGKEDDDAGGKWNVSVGKDVMQSMGKVVGVEVGDWEVVESRDL
jgi:hypothetical protein